MEVLNVKLQQGDLIMHHSHDWISNIIRKLDRTDFNHCSIYDKEGYLYESVRGGIHRKKIEQSLKDQNTDLITIFRVKNINKNKAYHLIETLKKYPKKGFAYSQILLIFSILWKKKINPPSFLDSLLNLLFLFFEKMISICIDGKKNKNMVCSELVYLTYLQTAKRLKDQSFIIHLPFECSTIFFLQKLKTQKLITCDLQKYDEHNKNWATKSVSPNINHTATANFFEISSNKYFLESLIKYFTKTKNYKKKVKKAEEIIKKIKFYNLITPGDLVRSLDTYPIATYKTKKALKNTSCKICVN